jgi:hypothetical protein
MGPVVSQPDIKVPQLPIEPGGPAVAEDVAALSMKTSATPKAIAVAAANASRNGSRESRAAKVG